MFELGLCSQAFVVPVAQSGYRRSRGCPGVPTSFYEFVQFVAPYEFGEHHSLLQPGLHSQAFSNSFAQCIVLSESHCLAELLASTDAFIHACCTDWYLGSSFRVRVWTLLSSFRSRWMCSWDLSKYHAVVQCGPSLINDTFDPLGSVRRFVYIPCRNSMPFEVGLLQLAVEKLGGYEAPLYRRCSL